ncbi:hypothetical protein LTR85_001710 [Meristemomyces frigidus]|nr:hypothetical protein LTR85_001710 [Meristemomyces frigidus]
MRDSPQAGSTTSVPPSGRLFAIVELVEGIAVHLAIQDILLVQRVSRIFRDTIASSTMLQKALFFQPVTTDFAFFSPEVIFRAFEQLFGEGKRDTERRRQNG